MNRRIANKIAWAYMTRPATEAKNFTRYSEEQLRRAWQVKMRCPKAWKANSAWATP